MQTACVAASDDCMKLENIDFKFFNKMFALYFIILAAYSGGAIGHRGDEPGKTLTARRTLRI